MVGLLDREPSRLRITPAFILGLHKNAFQTLFPSWAGSYRDRDVKVGSHAPPRFFEVPALMQHYCEDPESRLSFMGEKPPITNILLEALAFAEGRFLTIHPFRDFNGRIARILLFVLLYRLDLPPVPLMPDQTDREGRKEYFDALAQANLMNWQPLVEIWRRRLGID